MRILVLSGSTRTASFNTALAHLVARVRPHDAVAVDARLDRLPFYDGDVEAQGPPPPVAELARAVAAADLVVFTTPEYNGATPGLVGNAIDWLSRPHGRSPLHGKPVIVLTASPSPAGGVRAGRHLRAVLAEVAAQVHPEGVAVPRAHRALSAADAVTDVETRVRALLARATGERTAA